MKNSCNSKKIIDITIRLGFVILLIAWCIHLLIPFTSVILWGVIVAMAATPLYHKIMPIMGGRKKLTAFLLVLAGLLIIAIPAWLFLDSIIAGVSEIKQQVETAGLTIPLPNEKIKTWPFFGPKIYQIWVDASLNLEATITKYNKQLLELGNFFLQQVMGIGGSILQMIVATIIAGVLLVTQSATDTIKSMFRKLMGDRGDEFADIMQKTINNVVTGVFGVAIIQAVLVGSGFLLSGIPYAGLWALIVLILAILQLPAILVVLPIILYLFSEMNLTPAILWSIYLLLAGASDNLLKPILLGKGAPVPMLVIFLGVLGGFITSGFIGLFTGAIVLSIGYKLFMLWMKPEEVKEKLNRFPEY